MKEEKTDYTKPAEDAYTEPPLLEITTTLPETPDEDDPNAPTAPQYDKTVPVLLDDLIQTRLLLQADSGGGKSWAIRYIMEQTYSVVPQVIIDIEGEFSTLRERYPYVLVSATEGEGDLRANPATAGPLCRKVAELGASVIIDLYDLDETDQQLFVANYAAELLSLPKELWTPSLVIIDEAERVAPEQGAAVSKSMVSSLVKRARKRRLGVILAAQNLSDLSKKAARSLHNKMIGLATLDTDIKRSAAELGFDKDRARELSELEAGTFFAHGSAFPYRGVRLIRTGPVETTHDPLSQRDTPPEAIQTPETLMKVLTELSTIESGSGGRSDAEDPNHTVADEERLRSDITTRLEKHYEGELQRRLREDIDQQVEERTTHLKDRISSLQGYLDEAHRHARNCLNTLESLPPAESLTQDAQAESPHEDQTAPETQPEEDQYDDDIWNIDPQEIIAFASRGDEHWAEDLSDTHRSILGELEFLRSHKVRSVDRKNLALLSGRSPRSSAYDDTLAYLKKVGLIYYPEPGQVGITSRARTVVTYVLKNGHNRTSQEDGDTLEQLHREWLTYLGPSRSLLLEPLIQEYPEHMTREELARRSGRSSRSSAFDDALAQMRKIGLIEYPGKGRVRAARLLFPEGLT